MHLSSIRPLKWALFSIQLGKIRLVKGVDMKKKFRRKVSRKYCRVPTIVRHHTGSSLMSKKNDITLSIRQVSKKTQENK